MNKFPPLNILVAVALIAIAAENAWSEETAPAAPATQTAAPETGYAPGRYPPRPNQGGYAQPWTQPSQRPAPPPGYGQSRPYYPPYGQYQAVPAAPAENPLSAELKQTQEQLAAKNTELDTTREELTKVQAKLQAATAALQKAQADTVNAGIQVDDTMAQVDTLRKILCELAARLETRKTALENALQSPAAKPDDPESTAAGEVDLETTEQAEPKIDLQCSQLAPTPAITSGQRGVTLKSQTMAPNNEPSEPESRQDSR